MNTLQTETAHLASRVPGTSSVILRARGIRKLFGGLAVLDGVSFDLSAGEVVVLRGDNGSGKTTLLNILTGNLEPDEGELSFAGNGRQEAWVFPRRVWGKLSLFSPFAPEQIARYSVGRAWQDIRLFQTQTIADNLLVASTDQPGETPYAALFRRGTVQRREAENIEDVRRLLASLGIEQIQNRNVDQISLGQAKRVAIGRAMQGKARLLFLDEPFSGLDSAGVDKLLEVLTYLVRSHALTLVIVEHSWHIPRLLPIATRVWTMSNGHLVSESADEVRSQLEAGGPLNAIATAVGRDRVIENRRIDTDARLTIFRGPEHASSFSPVIEVRGLTVKRGARLVMGDTPEGLSFSLGSGDIAVIMAPNGWGKTSLAEAMCGLVPISCGTLLLQGNDLTNASPWERARQGLHFVQARNRIFPSLSVREMMHIENVDASCGLPKGLIRRRVADLSGGERQRVVLTCALNRRGTRLLMLDEPFNMLDNTQIRDFVNTLVCRPGQAILILLPSTTDTNFRGVQ